MTATLAPLLAAISAATQWLEGAGIEAAIVGGIAASIHGQPRVTKDVDFVAIAEPSDSASLVEAAAAFGIVPRIDDALELALTTRVCFFVMSRRASRSTSVSVRFRSSTTWLLVVCE